MDEKTRELVKVRLEKADEDIDTAGELLSLKRYRAAVNRAHYALFSVTTALLLTKKIERAKHAGVEAAPDAWRLPFERLPADFRKQNGTTVVLMGLDRRFDPKDIEAKIIEGTPIKAPHFKVRINNHTVTPRSLTGHKVSVIDGTPFGPVTGEIVILPETAALTKDLGIEVKVKQVTVRRELFGMETWGRAMARVTGEVNADFLHVTSDRTGFLKDSDEYRAFVQVMAKIMEDVKAFLQKLTTRKEGKRVSRALKDALQRVYRSLSLNPELSPFGPLPIGDPSKIGGDAASAGNEKAGRAEEVKPEGAAVNPAEPEKKKQKRSQKSEDSRRMRSSRK